MKKYLQGSVRLELKGARPERCLSRWAAAGLRFWDTVRNSELEYRCTALTDQLPALRREAERAQCSLRVLSEAGLPKLLRRLRRRPLLLCGLPFVICLALFLQNFVWFIRLEGSAELPTQKILHALWEEGVRFGAWCPGLDPVRLNSRLLNRLPELNWITVNHKGGLVTVSCSERATQEQAPEPNGITNLIATRPGLIRQLHVTNGFAAVKEGDLVEAGDVLVSGTMEWTTHLQTTRATGEVYASTLHSLELIYPASGLEKVYTGREEQCVTLIFQRKRRKISGNSSIFGTSCDRMIKTSVLSLPGAYELPVSLEIETLREYQLVSAPIPDESIGTLLNREAERLVAGELNAGKIETSSTLIQKTKDSCRCRASINCVELISKSVPVELWGEDDDYGKADQRGTD